MIFCYILRILGIWEENEKPNPEVISFPKYVLWEGIGAKLSVFDFPRNFPKWYKRLDHLFYGWSGKNPMKIREISQWPKTLGILIPKTDNEKPGNIFPNLKIIPKANIENLGGFSRETRFP